MLGARRLCPGLVSPIPQMGRAWRLDSEAPAVSLMRGLHHFLSSATIVPSRESFLIGLLCAGSAPLWYGPIPGCHRPREPTVHLGQRQEHRRP